MVQFCPTVRMEPSYGLEPDCCPQFETTDIRDPPVCLNCTCHKNVILFLVFLFWWHNARSISHKCLHRDLKGFFYAGVVTDGFFFFFLVDGLYFFDLRHIHCKIQTNVFKLSLNLCIMLPFLIKLLAAWSDIVIY